MISLEQVRNRLKVLDDRSVPVKAELDAMSEAVTPEQQARYNELAQALAVMIGRRMECEAWIEILEAYPGVSRPDQLPTKANTPAYEPVTERASPREVARSREQMAQADARELISFLPATPDGQ